MAATGTACQRKPKKLGPRQTYFDVPLSMAFRTEPAHGKRFLVIVMVRVGVLRSAAFARLRRDVTMFCRVMESLVCGKLFGMSQLMYALAGNRKSQAAVDMNRETEGRLWIRGSLAQVYA